ncbi:tol-pal system YbgF family protein [Pontiella sp.]|uniref:tetratricopeptide repeat protein n=1 Tax=Pontiella sp. TaxID=2837462 RepID=UPI003563D8B7
MKMILAAAAALWVAGSAAAQSDYAAKVTVNSGNSFVVKQLKIQGDRLYQTTGSSSVALSMVELIEFRFSGVSLNMCESMFYRGDRKALEGLLEQSIGPVAQYSNLPTNLGRYLVWWLRAQYWNGSDAAAGRTIGYIRQTGQQELIDIASMYFTVMLLDQGKPDSARTVFSSIGNPAAVSVPMSEYIQGRLALLSGDTRGAMQRVAQIVAFHGRDEEWMPPATVLEAQIYQQMGLPHKAAAVAEELMIAYPDSNWSREGEKIKMESTGTRGG